MAAVSGSIGKIGGGAAALAFGLVPAFAEPQANSLVHEGYVPALSRHIRMMEGASGAVVAYFNDIMTGGVECPEGAVGNAGCLYWDGFTAYFEVTLEGVTETDALELKKGVISAIEAVCPSAKGLGLKASDVAEMAPHFYRIEAFCPAIETRRGN
ncbi:hypothetical protein [Rhodobacter maris]|uniref:Uncharacterized protein n=1 Tax=Rhodobacter maris TaxID=446682 RepID=A0A285SQP1_9RHOB|nr:hypothetical protein [Rhodobacter maris]SOC10313.1 hypothetical protein SAMN05877831_10846 [Rhodobacter maris]